MGRGNVLIPEQGRRRDKIECAVFTVVLQFYSLQQLFGLEGIGNLMLPVIILYALWRMVCVLRTYRPMPYIVGLTLLLALFTAYGIEHILFGRPAVITAFHLMGVVPTFYFLKNILLSLSVIYVYVYFAMRGVFSPRSIFAYMLLFLCSAVFMYFHFYSTLSNGASSEYVEGATNNVGYSFVPIMAMLLLVKKWRLPLLLVCLGFIIMGLKRGAMISAVVAMSGYFYCLYAKSRGFSKIAATAAIALVIGIIAYAGVALYNTNAGFEHRVNQTLEGQSSGRDELSEDIIKFYFRQTDEIAFLFGNGADASVGVVGNYAHNDWLEILVNQGMLGILVYLVYFLLWFRNWRQMKGRVPVEVYAAFGVALAVQFFKTIFSMSYTGYGPAIDIIIGYSLYRLALSRQQARLSADQTA